MDEHTFIYDDFAWKLAGHLLEDFKPLCPANSLDAVEKEISLCNPLGLRTLMLNELDLNPYSFKLLTQIYDLFKKYQFSHDLYTPTELRDLSIKKFLDNQNRLLNFRIEPDSVAKQILFSARGYIDEILGYFDPLEIMEKATFGKKSSVGIPMRLACEGERYEAPITGSRDHILWFSKIYSCYNRPAYLYAERRAASSQKPLFKEIDTVEAVLVDKTWKSLRMICPNTTIGTLYSGGLGSVIEDRLRKYGYDIRHLQPVHGELARFGSITGSLVTADQSMASDNITVQLVDLLFPRSWASALKLGRIEGINLYGTNVKTPTFSTMGIGFTFPLQTLVFLALLLAIKDHLMLDEHTVVSVFGDDLIYDERMHDLVMSTFPQFGLVINADKTFALGNFRESCGYDYFHGLDVRPYFLGRSEGISAGKRRSESYLYRVFNGLRLRWSYLECPSTFQFIISEIRRVRGSEPLVVPTDYPDTSGCKITRYDAEFLLLDRWPRRDIHGVYHFRYLAFEAELREERRHEPYLFRRLMVCSQTDYSGQIVEERAPVFTDVPDPNGRTYRNSHSGKRTRRQIPMIPQQDRGRYRERPGVTSNWTPVTKRG